MKTSIVVGSLLTALTLTVPLQAQQVAADVVVRSGPVAGRVVVGNGYSTYRRPVTYRRAPERVIAVERVAPRVIVVERVRKGHGHKARHWRKQGYRTVVVYYRDGRYYDRYERGWPEMRQVTVYERGGRYYRDDDYGNYRDGHRDCDRDHDRRWHD